MTCPSCGAEIEHMLYCGIPVLLCDGPAHHVTGAWAWTLEVLPFNGMFVRYEAGDYWPTLWRWVKGEYS